MANVKFSRYSEGEWCAIVKEVARVSSSVERHVANKVGLRDKLEQLGRDYVSAPSIDSKELKFLAAKENQAAEFRRQMVGLPPELERCAADTAGKIERYCQDGILQLGQDYNLQIRSIEAGPHYLRISYISARPENAHLAALDWYFESLLDVWMSIGGDWSGRSNTKAIRNFIAACVQPVVGAKSAGERAIRERLYRLDKRRCRTDDFDRHFAAACRVARVSGHFERKQILIGGSFADLPSNANEP